MSAELLIANLLRVAKEDLDGARLLSSGGNRNAIYLCGQAAEKIIRAVLTSEGKHAGIKHQLKEMIDLVPDENPLKPAGDRASCGVRDDLSLPYRRREDPVASGAE